VSSPAGSLDQYGVDRATTLVLLGSELDSLDPAGWEYGGDNIIGDMFSGLVRLGANMEPVPDLAESWEVSPDGLTYTFHLRQNVTFHNGKTFTAEDVRYSWERALGGEAGTDLAQAYMYDIIGADDLVDGNATGLSGLTIIDDHTLQVTLDSPKAYFLYKLAYPSSWIVDSETIDEIETQPNGTGPFILQEHIENEVYVLRRNPDYYLGPAQIENVVYLIYAGYPVQLYESGDIDLVSINKDLLPRALNPQDPLFGNVQATNGLCSSFLALDTTMQPFDDPLVRQAFIMAVDKEALNETAWGGQGVIADGLYPPGMPGHTEDLSAPVYDPEAAKQALHDSSYGGAEALPEVIYTTYGSAGFVSPEDTLMIQSWQEVLGVRVTLDALDPDSFLEKTESGDHGQIVWDGWCADFPDPESFADLFYSASWLSSGYYNNPEYDELLDRARLETEASQRIAMYQKAQQILIDDAAAIFLNHSSAYYIVTKPYLKGYLATPIGVPQTMNLSLEYGN
jgi:oligopeptide transport system substrate-binding protein